MSRRIIISSVAAGVVVVTAAAGGFAYVKHREQVRLDLAARTSADRFAVAWSQRDVKDLPYAGRSADQVAASFKSTTAGLGRAPVKVTVTSLTRAGDQAKGILTVSWTVAEGSAWAYPMPITLQRNKSSQTWAVVARDGASMWAPGLSAQTKLSATRTFWTGREHRSWPSARSMTLPSTRRGLPPTRSRRWSSWSRSRPAHW